MKLEICNDHLPVLGWCETSECPCYEQLAEEVRDGYEITYNSSLELDEDELCTFIFYDEYSKGTLHAVFSGRVNYLGHYPDHSAPHTYVFYPEKEIKIRCVGHSKDDGSPQVIILKSKIL
jgi:hypothetical protein